MSETLDGREWHIAAVLPGEYPRLVRLCQRLVHDRSAAEELAQETLVEAWRHADKLHDPAGYRAWFSAVARHVCRRWHSKRARALRRLAAYELSDVWAPDTPLLAGNDPGELLEREDLAALLDRALALLPSDTRALLVARYFTGRSHTEAADEMGLSEGAVAVRLHRGKAALRRVLESQFPGELAAYALASAPEVDPWRETRIWCPLCGRRKLAARVEQDEDDASFRCPACWAGQVQPIARTRGLGILDNVKSYKAILSRQLTWLNRFYRDALTQLRLLCPGCGRSQADVARRTGPEPHLSPSEEGIQITCAACGWLDFTPLAYLVLDLPETQRFWRAHPKMRLHSERRVEHAGRDVIATTYESLTGGARLDVLSAADTLDVLAIYGSPPGVSAVRST